MESVKYFREENDGKLPSLKSLKKRKEELTKEIAERKKVYTCLLYTSYLYHTVVKMLIMLKQLWVCLKFWG